LAAADREFRLALLQSTETCKNKSPACNGGNYDPTPSPRRLEPPPRYDATNAAFINRHDGPEDGHLSQRCLNSGLPEFGSAFGGSFRRIVQTPGGISMFYDFGQGQGFQRSIVMDGSPHLPASIRQWFGDSRGHWEGDSLVIDVTNFSPKTDFQGSRENLHLIERWRRTGPTMLQYEVTMEDSTVWTRPWTVKQEFTKQSDAQNRIYYEPRCVKEITPFQACYMRRAWKNSPLRRDGVLTRQHETGRRLSRAPRMIHCNNTHRTPAVHHYASGSQPAHPLDARMSPFADCGHRSSMARGVSYGPPIPAAALYLTVIRGTGLGGLALLRRQPPHSRLRKETRLFE
jgi:hypothetical protein